MPRDTVTEFDDGDLLARYAAGDAQAARLLATRLLPAVLRYAARLLGDRHEAEDVAQEAMLRLWRAAPEWRAGEARVSAWLYRVAGNLCFDRHRARRRRPVQPLADGQDIADAGQSAEAGLIAAERMAALNAALAALPERQRQAVVLRHIEGLSNPEIADVLEIGVEAVESLTARGKRALTLALEARVLEDAARLQTKRVARRAPVRGFWAQASTYFGGGGMLAAMGTAALAGLYLGFVQPVPVQGISDALLATAPMDSVELMPGMDGFLSEGQSDE